MADLNTFVRRIVASDSTTKHNTAFGGFSSRRPVANDARQTAMSHVARRMSKEWLFVNR
jgi:hypothetical protein